jgi:hypothetical protein
MFTVSSTLLILQMVKRPRNQQYCVLHCTAGAAAPKAIGGRYLQCRKGRRGPRDLQATETTRGSRMDEESKSQVREARQKKVR